MSRLDEVPPEDRWFWQDRPAPRVIDVPARRQRTPLQLFGLTLALILCAVVAWPIVVVLATMATG